jgi:hypothetical protein
MQFVDGRYVLLNIHHRDLTGEGADVYDLVLESLLQLRMYI